MDTVKVKTAVANGNPDGEVLINACDYNPDVHTCCDAEEEKAMQKAAKQDVPKQDAADEGAAAAGKDIQVVGKKNKNK